MQDPKKGVSEVVKDGEKNITFLGGIFLDSQLSEIESSAKRNVQHAADSLQKAFLQGFSQIDKVKLGVVSVPFISSFPRGDRTIWFPARSEKMFGGVTVLGMGFLNVLILRVYDRYRAARKGLLLANRNRQAPVIVVYSAHAPFLLAALAARRMDPSIRIFLILPDFPEFMGEGGFKYKVLSGLNTRLFYSLVPKLDHFVVLTKAMGQRLKLEPEQYTVIEGIYDPAHETGEPVWSCEPGPIFIYTGTLAARYGILDLLAAFDQLDVPSAQLWVCGDGDARSAVEQAAQKDPRVTYHGRVRRSEALSLQARAHVMINPRNPEGEFTRYSFPSKTMEYLASGRPVVMHWLPGMPEEYRPYLITPPRSGAQGLAAAMAQVAAMDAEELCQRGAAGRAFVLDRKTPKIQVGRMLADLFPKADRHLTEIDQGE